MFKKLFGSFKKEQPANNSLAIDLSLGYPRFNEFASYLIENNYSKFEAEYEKLSWDAKTLLSDGLGLSKDYASAIERWVNKQPDSVVSNLFAGVSKTGLAWLARTAALGKNVSEESANKYFDLLSNADTYLTKADEIDPENAEVCARIIRVFMGLGEGEEAALSYFNAAVELEPNHLTAHLMMINYLNPKWGGSIEKMYDFANSRVKATGNSLMVTLELFAIVEEWLFYNINGENAKHRSFFSDANLQTKVNELYKDYIEEADGALLIPYVYNYFSFIFWQMKNKELAREIIKKIPGKLTVYPWAYDGVESNAQLQGL